MKVDLVKVGRHSAWKYPLMMAALALSVACGGSAPHDRPGGPGDDNPRVAEDPGGDLPSLIPGAWGPELSENEIHAASEAISKELERLRPTAPESLPERARLIARVLRQVPNVRVTNISQDNQVTVQLRDGTPILIFTQRRPAGQSTSSPDSDSQLSERTPGQEASLGTSQQGVMEPCDARTPSPNDEELPSSNQALLVDVESTGIEAAQRIKAALERKRYRVAVSDGSVDDLRFLVRDLAVFWISTHGKIGTIQLGPDPTAPAVGVLAVGTSQRVVYPCEAAPDCTALRADNDFRNGRWGLIRVQFLQGGPEMWAITREFVRKYWRFNSQSIVYMDGCETGKPSSPAVAFMDAIRDAHAGHVLGWDDQVSKGGAAEVSSVFFDVVAGANLYKPETPKRRPFNAARTYDWIKATGRDVDIYGTAHLIHKQHSVKAVALAPSVKVMQVDEDDNKLHLYGDFGTQRGTISIAGHDAHVSSWAAHEIIVDQLSPSLSGNVIAKVRDHESNSVPLSSWQGTMRQTWIGNDTHGPPGPQYVAECQRLHFRADAHAYRCSPGGTPVRGGYGDGIIYFQNAASDTQCTWTTSGSGIRGNTLAEFEGPNTGPLTWRATTSPQLPMLKFLGRIETGNTVPITSARATFSLIYANVLTMRLTNLSTGQITRTPVGPMFNMENATLNTWYPLDPTLAFPARNGISVPVHTDHDTRRMDYNISIIARETADTES